MEIVRAIILGMVQGLSEFLPISSSAHLILVPAIFGWRHFGLTFDVALHVGTASAVLFYFRNTWISLAKAFFSSRYGRKIETQHDRTLVWLLIVGTIPGALAGGLGESFIEKNLRSPIIIAVASIVFALILLVAERTSRRERTLGQITLADSLVIGISQALALIPGVSRSGITITTALVRDFNPRAAAEFSFLLSTPIVVGAALKKSVHFVNSPPATQTELLVFAAGVLSSAITGSLCIKYFLRYLKTRTLLPFVIYRIILGVVLIIMYFRELIR